MLGLDFRSHPFRTSGVLALLAVVASAVAAHGCVGSTPSLSYPGHLVEIDAVETVSWTAPLPVGPAVSRQVADSLRYEKRLRAWLVEQFRADAKRLVKVSPSETPVVTVTIRDDPPTPPGILDGLGEGGAIRRGALEEQIVEIHFIVFVAGVSARDVIRFEAFSCFETWEGNPSGIPEIALHGPLHGTPIPQVLAESLGGVLPANQGLRSEVTRATVFKSPTRYTNAVVLDLEGEVAAYRYVLFSDDPSEDGVSVDLTAGVFLAVDHPRGAILLHHSYYQGQPIPGILAGFVRSGVRSATEEFARLYEKLAPGWLADHPESR